MAGRRRDPLFLEPLLTAWSTRYGLRNARNGLWLAGSVDAAVNSTARRRGWLGRETVDLDLALVIAPCAAVHTGFMRFSIDVLFVARDGRVVKCRHDVRPWRIAAAWRAFAAIELAPGSIRRSQTRCGDRLVLAPMAPSGEMESTAVPFRLLSRSLY